MAEEGGGHNPMKDVYFLITFLVIVVILWYASGGPARADLRGIFLGAPEPLGNGQAYGPTDPTFSTGSVQDTQQVQY